MQSRTQEYYIQIIQNKIFQGITNPTEILSQLIKDYLDDIDKVINISSSMWNVEQYLLTKQLAKQLDALLNPKLKASEILEGDHLAIVIRRLNQASEETSIHHDLVKILSAYFSIFSMYNRMFTEKLDKILNPKDVWKEYRSTFESILVKRMMENINQENVVDRSIRFDLIAKFYELIPSERHGFVIDEIIKNVNSNYENLRINACKAIVSLRAVIIVSEKKQDVVEALQKVINIDLGTNINPIFKIIAQCCVLFSITEQHDITRKLIEEMKPEKNPRRACMALCEMVDFVQEDQVETVVNALAELTCDENREIAEIAKDALFQFRKKLTNAMVITIIDKLLLKIQTPWFDSACKFIFNIADTIPEEMQKRVADVFQKESSLYVLEKLGVKLHFSGLLTDTQRNYNVHTFTANLQRGRYYTLSTLCSLTPLLLRSDNIPNDQLKDICDEFIRRLMEDDDSHIVKTICTMIKQFKHLLPNEKINSVIESLEKNITSPLDFPSSLRACETVLELLSVYPQINLNYPTLMQLVYKTLSEHADQITEDTYQTLKSNIKLLSEEFFNDIANTLTKKFASNFLNIKESSYNVACMLLDIMPAKSRIDLMNELALNVTASFSPWISRDLFNVITSHTATMKPAEQIVFLSIAAKNATLDDCHSKFYIEFYMQLLTHYQSQLNLEMLYPKKLNKEFGLPLESYQKIYRYVS